LEVKLLFKATTELDETNWVVDFGGLKEVKQYLEQNFDHKTLIAKDDPERDYFLNGYGRRVMDVILVDAVGCEAFAQQIFRWVSTYIQVKFPHASLYEVEVREHSGNSAIVRRK